MSTQGVNTQRKGTWGLSTWGEYPGVSTQVMSTQEGEYSGGGYLGVSTWDLRHGTSAGPQGQWVLTTTPGMEYYNVTSVA